MGQIYTQPIAEAVFADIKRKATKKQIFGSIRNGYFEAYIIPELFPGIHLSDTKDLRFEKEDDKKEMERIWKESDDINDKRASAIAEAFRSEHKDKYITVLSYGDEDGSFPSILEHTQIFNRLEHIETSYH